MSSDSTSLHEYEPLKGSRKENSSIFKIIGCVLGVMAIGALVGLAGMDTSNTTATTNFEEQSLSGQGVANSFGSVQSAKVQEAVAQDGLSSSVQSAKVEEAVKIQQGNELSSSAASRCSGPPQTGPCKKTYLSKYYYNARARACRKFIYGGCGGNSNNFKTRTECEATCSSSGQSAKAVQGVENTSCGPICKMYCPFGFQRVNGCEICKCACSPMHCLMYCPHGYEEIHGCKICQCRAPPRITPVNDEPVRAGNEFSTSCGIAGDYGHATISESGSSLSGVWTSSRPNFSGSFTSGCSGSINFPDDKTYTFTYSKTDCKINWSNGGGWAKTSCTPPPAKPSHFCVVHNPNVLGVFADLEKAKQKLSTVSSGSRLICEVKDGAVQTDPHTVGGQNQGAGSAAGFNKWWADWWDINRMIQKCKDDTACKTGPQLPDRYVTGPSVVKETILIPTLHWTQSYGGNGGSPFSTQSCFPWGIKRIRIWGGRWVDKVQFQCRNGDWKYPSGGLLQGAVNEFEVPSTDYVNGVRVYSGTKIDAIDVRIAGFVTSSEKYLGKIGGSGGNLHTVYGSGDKKELYAFAGRAGDVLDQLRFAFGVTKAFCAVAEEIAGKKCEKLMHDTSAKTSGDCNAACCKDVSCGVWQFDSSNRCWREDSTHQTGMCTKEDASVVAGYRLVGDSVKGAVFEGQPKITPPPLPHGSPPSTAWPACWIDSYGRGVGEPLSTCPQGDEKNGLLCYPACKTGYYGVGPVCWEKCPPNWNDGGVFCNVWMHTVTAQVDCPWYDCCGLTFAKGCTKCPSGYANHGCLCTKPPKHMTKSAYGRTAGKPMICPSHLEQQLALCYDRCASGYAGVGPVCWGQCPSSHPHKCGPLMCTKSSAECSEKIGNLAKNIFLKGGIPGLIGLADELCIPKCGDQRHMACTILGKVNDAVSVCPLDISKCPQAFKCLSFLGKRAEEFAKGISKLMSGGALKDFNSFFTGSGGIQGCIKAAGGWFSNKGQGCDVQNDGTFKEFAKCSVPIFKGMFLDDFSSPSLYISVGASGVLGIVGGGTSFDVFFGFDGSIIFSYTTCNTLSTPDLGGGISVSIGMFGSKNDISGESYVLAAGAGIPGTDIDANAEVTYSADGERVIGMGANFGVGLGLELAPVSASCSNCDTKLLGCATTLDEIGLGYLM